MITSTSSDPTGRRPGSILGTRVQRREDPALLTGAAVYTPDLPGHEVPDALHAVFVPSPIAHGRLGAVHATEARTMPGVVAVLTGADLAHDLGIGAHNGFVPIHERFTRHPIALDMVRFVGEPIALVIATTRAAGVDAAQTIWAEIDPLPPVLDTAEGEAAFIEIKDAPVDLEAISARVVRGTYINQRVAVVAMEPDGCLAVPDPDGHLTLWASTQMPHLLRTQLAAALDLPAEQVRVRTPQVGGGFGGKAGLHHEVTAVAAAARHLGRPVLWAPARSEDLVSMPHGRGQIQWAELGLDAEGHITGLRCHILGDAGAYPTVGAALVGGTRRMSPGNYAIPATQVHAVSTVTHTTPVGAYRGAGRPEATAMLERLIDQAARELEIDPVEFRRRNLLADTAFPHTTTTGVTYDSGRYAHALDVAVAAADYTALRAEQQRRRAAAERWQLGIGVACYVEITAGGSAEEFGAVTVHPDGSATVAVGTAAHGQGHATSFAMLVSEATGIPIERITHVDGDTDRVPRGGGTGGSRSLQLGGSAVLGATDALIDRARTLAARLLEADAADVVLDAARGQFHVAGVPASAVGWAALATSAEAAGEPLGADHVFTQSGATFPFGAHIAVVEVDTETGAARLIRHIAVDDCGTVLNPTIVEGQQHGGIASGLGQALYEEVRYDAAGNPQTSTLAEYALPSAAEMPSFEVHSTETPSPLNPLGAKGIGEAGTIGSTPAIQNAVIDAVAHLGVRHIDMPCTPERIWRALADRADPWREPPAIFANLRAERAAAAARPTERPDLDAAADGI